MYDNALAESILAFVGPMGGAGECVLREGCLRKQRAGRREDATQTRHTSLQGKGLKSLDHLETSLELLEISHQAARGRLRGDTP